MTITIRSAFLALAAVATIGAASLATSTSSEAMPGRGASSFGGGRMGGMSAGRPSFGARPMTMNRVWGNGHGVPKPNGGGPVWGGYGGNGGKPGPWGGQGGKPGPWGGQGGKPGPWGQGGGKPGPWGQAGGYGGGKPWGGNHWPKHHHHCGGYFGRHCGHGHYPRPVYYPTPSYTPSYVAPTYVAPTYVAPAPAVYTAPAPAYVAPATYTPAPAPAAGPCTCLTKEYTQDGQIVMKDTCTNEVLAAPRQQ